MKVKRNENEIFQTNKLPKNEKIQRNNFFPLSVRSR